MIALLYALLVLGLAALPALMVFRNLPLFLLADSPATEQRHDGVESVEPISVLIPARDEEDGISAAIDSVLSNQGIELEVVVLDDHSQDNTSEIVGRIAESDARVRLIASQPLPDGWNGKQFACWQLSEQARYPLLLFMDADVRLEPQALESLIRELNSRQVQLLSGFPRQIMQSPAEQLLIPMMYFVLLGYLPLDQMRATTRPEFGAGCGQLFLTHRQAYAQADGHRSIRGSRHDGLKLPRSYRAAGLRTDLLDASSLAQVRMYAGTVQVGRGLLKNATEGIAQPRLIVLFTMLLLGASVLPVASFAHALFYGWAERGVGWMAATIVLGCATCLSFWPRWWIARRLESGWLGWLLHPLAVAVFVALQWLAFARERFGLSPVSWRGRK